MHENKACLERPGSRPTCLRPAGLALTPFSQSLGRSSLFAHDRTATDMKFIDLTQDFSLHTPAFAGYAGPAIRWIKRLAFDKAGGQEITMTLHVSTHLDAPAHFFSGGKFIGDLPLDFLIGPACVVDLEKMGLGDYDLYGP